MKTLITSLLLLLLFSCSENSKTIDHKQSELLVAPLSNGTWYINCLANDSTSIPFRLEIRDGLEMTIVNHKEIITIDSVQINEDSITITMPRFHSQFVGKITSQNSFEGRWYNYFKKEYFLPFEANLVSEDYLSNSTKEKSMKYDVTFSPGSIEDEYKAIGLFNLGTDYSYGTFITETGDYRFLEGNINDEHLTLSCFDGSHLFLFEAELENDSLINGRFYSGKHWFEPWNAQQRDDVSIRNPDSLTFLLEGHETVEFTVQNLSGDSVRFDRDFYKNKVSIIQIFGSWCPNCMDENIFYKDLYNTYNSEGLEIIPVAFEPGENFKDYSHYASKHFQDIDMPYEPYIGGKVGKSRSSEMFYMLNNIMSYPTSIFIDKNGKVRKVHTGFYGPGTEDYYSQYVMEIKSFIEELLNE